MATVGVAAAARLEAGTREHRRGAALKDNGGFGSVTALAFSPDGRTLLCGVGPCVEAFDVRTGTKTGACRVLPSGSAVHKLHFLGNSAMQNAHSAQASSAGIPDEKESKTGTVATWVVAACGVRTASMLLVSTLPSSDNSTCRPFLARCGRILRLSTQIQDVCTARVGGREAVVIGLAYNQISVFLYGDGGDGRHCFSSAPAIGIECTDRSLTYCMSLLRTSDGGLLVASGTAFREILVWKPHFRRGQASSSPLSAVDTGAGASPLKIKPLLRIDGHKGAIFDLAWSAPTQAGEPLSLCSVSDDRTTRMWEVTPGDNSSDKSSTDATADEFNVWRYQPVSTSFGHGARVWRCALVRCPLGPARDAYPCAISTGEDATIRAWAPGSAYNKAAPETACLSSPSGGSIWSLAVTPFAIGSTTGVIVAAGAKNSSVRLWALKWTQQGDDGSDGGVMVLTRWYGGYRMPTFIPRLVASAPAEPTRRGLVRIGNERKRDHVRVLRVVSDRMVIVGTSSQRLFCVDVDTSERGGITWHPLTLPAGFGAPREGPGASHTGAPRMTPPASQHKWAWTFVQVKSNVIIAGTSRGQVAALSFSPGPAAAQHDSSVGVQWWAHQTGVSGIWFDNFGEKATSTRVWTADAIGELVLWNVHLQGPDRSADRSAVIICRVKLSRRRVQVSSVQSMKAPAAIVAVIGDSKGGLSVLALGQKHGDTFMKQEAQNVTLHIPSAHGSARVNNVYVQVIGGITRVWSCGAGGSLAEWHLSWQGGPSRPTLRCTRRFRLGGTLHTLHFPEKIKYFAGRTGITAVGFQGVDMVVWDLDTGHATVRLRCGGSRRPWGLVTASTDDRPTAQSSQLNAIEKFVVSGYVAAYTPPRSCLVETDPVSGEPCAFYLHMAAPPKVLASVFKQSVLRSPAHSALITAVRSCTVEPSGNEVIFSVSEDHLLLVSTVDSAGHLVSGGPPISDAADILRCLSVCPFTKDAKTGAVFPQLVFCAGGQEHLLAYHVTTEGALVAAGACGGETVSRSKHKRRPDPTDARILSISAQLVRTLSGSESVITHVVAAGHSSGTLRIWGYVRVERKFVQLGSSGDCYMSPILSISAQVLCGNSLLVVTGDSRGRVRFWNATAAARGKGTDPMPLQYNDMLSYEGHQSGVNAMKAWRIAPSSGVSTSGCQYFGRDYLLVVTGGDDQRLSVACVCIGKDGGVVARAAVDSAHTSAIKAIDGEAQLNDTGDGLCAVVFWTTGYDQRVREWRLSVDMRHKSPRIALRPSGRVVITDVPDTSALAIMPPRQDGVRSWTGRLVVAGQGMQIFDFE